MGLIRGGFMDVLKKINKMRLERKWSIYRLSVESGVPLSTITNMFNRETLPSIPTLKNLCDAFEITMSDFFKEETKTLYDSQDDTEILTLFNKLSKEEKNGLLILLRAIKSK